MWNQLGCRTAAETRRLVKMNAARCSTTVEVHRVEKLPVVTDGTDGRLAVTFTACWDPFFILFFPLSWMCSRLIFRAAFLWKTADHIALGRSWRELASQLGASEAARICDVFANLSATRVVPQQLRTHLPVRSFIITEGTFSSRVALLSNRLTC